MVFKVWAVDKMSHTWKFVRNAGSQAHPQPFWIRNAEDWVSAVVLSEDLLLTMTWLKFGHH